MKRLDPYNSNDAKLVDAVQDQMKKQILHEYWTAIDELLYFVPRKYLIGFLPEDQWINHQKSN